MCSTSRGVGASNLHVLGKAGSSHLHTLPLTVGLNEEESQAAEPPAKRHKPLSTSKKTAPDPTSQPCDGQRETRLNQENIVSPPMPSTLHTSASPSLLASPLELPSSQHTMVRWGPMSPAFLIRGQTLYLLVHNSKTFYLLGACICRCIVIWTMVGQVVDELSNW